MKITTTALALSLAVALAPAVLAAPQRGQAGEHQERGHQTTERKKGQEHQGTQRGAEHGGQRDRDDAHRDQGETQRPKDAPHQGETQRPKDAPHQGETHRPKDAPHQDEVHRPKDQEVVRPKDQRGEVHRPGAGHSGLPANYRGLLESYAAHERTHMERNARIQRLQELAAQHHQPERVEALQDLHRRERMRYIAYQEDLKARVGAEVFEKLQHDVAALKAGKLHGPGHGPKVGGPVHRGETPEREHAEHGDDHDEGVEHGETPGHDDDAERRTETEREPSKRPGAGDRTRERDKDEDGRPRGGSE